VNFYSNNTHSKINLIVLLASVNEVFL